MAYSKSKHPAAWSRESAGGISAFFKYIDKSTLSIFDDALKRYKGCVSSPILDNRKTIQLFYPVSDWIKSMEMEALYGKGLIILKGFPVNDYAENERDRLFWLLGQCFGKPIQQNPEGDLLGRIEDIYGLQKKRQQFPQTRFRLAHFQLIKNDFIEDE